MQEVNLKEFTKEEWIALLMDKYNVDEEQATADVQLLIEKFSKEGLFDE